MGKQLSMSLISQDNKKYNETVELPVDVSGEEYIIKIYPFFSPIKVNNMLNEIGEFLNNAKKENVKIKDEDFDYIIGYYIVKYFTDIKFTSSKKPNRIYKEIKEAMNSKLFDVILKSIPEESIEYVYEKIFEKQEMVAKIENKLKMYKNILNELPLENRDILSPNDKKENKNWVNRSGKNGG